MAFKVKASSPNTENRKAKCRWWTVANHLTLRFQHTCVTLKWRTTPKGQNGQFGMCSAITDDLQTFWQGRNAQARHPSSLSSRTPCLWLCPSKSSMFACWDVSPAWQDFWKRQLGIWKCRTYKIRAADLLKIILTASWILLQTCCHMLQMMPPSQQSKTFRCDREIE